MHNIKSPASIDGLMDGVYFEYKTFAVLAAVRIFKRVSLVPFTDTHTE